MQHFEGEINESYPAGGHQVLIAHRLARGVHVLMRVRVGGQILDVLKAVSRVPASVEQASRSQEICAVADTTNCFACILEITQNCGELLGIFGGQGAP